MCVLNHCSHIWLFVTPWTVACQAPRSRGFSRQEYGSGMLCPRCRDWTHISYVSCIGRWAVLGSPVCTLVQCNRNSQASAGRSPTFGSQLCCVILFMLLNSETQFSHPQMGIITPTLQRFLWGLHEKCLARLSNFDFVVEIMIDSPIQHD